MGQKQIQKHSFNTPVKTILLLDMNKFGRFLHTLILETTHTLVKAKLIRISTCIVGCIQKNYSTELIDSVFYN